MPLEILLDNPAVFSNRSDRAKETDRDSRPPQRRYFFSAGLPRLRRLVEARRSGSLVLFWISWLSLDPEVRQVISILAPTESPFEKGD